MKSRRSSATVASLYTLSLGSSEYEKPTFIGLSTKMMSAGKSSKHVSILNYRCLSLCFAMVGETQMGCSAFLNPLPLLGRVEFRSD